MRFKPGMLGVTAVTLALVGMLLGSWVMSMDVNEREVTEYNPLAEIGSLFASEQTPTFTEYNPSTNYTGYYTNGSIIDGVRYFAGVDYDTSQLPNQYRLRLAPVDPSTDSYTLTDEYIVDDETITAEETRVIYTWGGIGDGGYPYTYSYSLFDLARALGYSDKKLTISSDNVPVDWTDTDNEFVLFTPLGKTVINAADERVAYVHSPGPIPEELPAKDYYYYPMLGCIYDQTTGLVNLYYDAECTQLAISNQASTDVYIWFDRSNSSWFGNEITIISETVPPAQYMDPSKGVELL